VLMVITWNSSCVVFDLFIRLPILYESHSITILILVLLLSKNHGPGEGVYGKHWLKVKRHFWTQKSNNVSSVTEVIFDRSLV